MRGGITIAPLDRAFGACCVGDFSFEPPCGIVAASRQAGAASELNVDEPGDRNKGKAALQMTRRY